MNHQELYKLLVTVQKNVRCPQCGKQYPFSTIQIRGIIDSIVFLELNCGSHMPLLATVTLGKQPVANKNKQNTDKVNSDDVINIYKQLKDFKGSFEELFSENKEKNSK